jgi:hypothetical protein
VTRDEKKRQAAAYLSVIAQPWCAVRCRSMLRSFLRRRFVRVDEICWLTEGDFFIRVCSFIHDGNPGLVGVIISTSVCCVTIRSVVETPISDQDHTSKGYHNFNQVGTEF